MVKFFLVRPFRISHPLADRLRKMGDSTPFTQGEEDGMVRTNIYFQSDMQGYIDFEVKVLDSNPGHVDKANVSVSIILIHA